MDSRYFVVGLLGRGGMGEVYLARDEVWERDVALKVLRREYAALKEFRERMGREAESAARLSHPNVVQVFDRGKTEDGLPYIVMEHMRGGTLAEKIRREGALGWREAAAIARQVALALAEAHRRGIVHRDIKPHNVFLNGDHLMVAGSVKVGDFGIARAATASTLTETSIILGTAYYLSPEQAKGDPIGPESDLYSLGTTLYQMLVGRVPFEAEGALATAMRHISEPPPSPREANPDVPEDLAAVTLLLLSKNPLARYGGDALALADDLKRVCQGLKPCYRGAPLTAESSPTEPLRTLPVRTRRERRGHRHSKRRVVGAATAAVLVLALTAGGAYSYGRYELPFLSSTNAEEHKEITPARPSLGSVETLSPPEQPQEKTTERRAEETGAAPVANTPPVEENPMPVQEELTATAPVTPEQEEETTAPAATVEEKKTQAELPKETTKATVTSTLESEEAEERTEDRSKAAKKAAKEAEEAREEAEKDRKKAAKEANKRAEDTAEEAQEKAEESAKKRRDGR